MPSSPGYVVGGPSPLHVSYVGAPNRAETGPADICIEASWLGGDPNDAFFSSATPLGTVDRLELYSIGKVLVGFAAARVVPSQLSAITRKLYEDALRVCRERHLFRMWNFVPRINDLAAGLENYRAFCQGRSLAFENWFGAQFHRHLPAASAVGSEGSDLRLIFVAGEEVPQHLENPEQIPAYRYPPEHGPRPPSFARGTIVKANGKTYIFLSGTSAIKGHVTIAPGALSEQLVCTMDNLRLISSECGAGDRLDAGRAGNRHFKVYLRRASDVAVTRSFLERELLQPSDHVTYLRADICRAALDVEIEATLVRG